MVAGKQAPCGKCDNAVKEKGLQCEVCLKWFHLHCAEIPEALYRGICKAQSGLKWLCAECDKKVGKMLAHVTEIAEKQEKAEKRMTDLDKEILELRNELRNGKQELKNRMDSFEAEVEGAKKEVDHVGKGVEEKIMKYVEAAKQGLTKEQLDKDKGIEVQVIDSIKEDREFQLRLTEAMERDKRKNNVVIMGLSENMTEQETNEFIEEMFTTMMEREKSRYEIKGRIGRSVQSNKCRPMRVEFEDPVYKRNLMKRANTLKRDSKYEKIFLSPDLTRKQQEEDKILRDKVKEYKSQGVEGVKINKGCVIKMEGSKRVVLFGEPPSID